MTKIYCEQDGTRVLISAKGHATGSEKACAAVSSLIYAFAGYLKNDPTAEILTLDIFPGDVVIQARGGASLLGAFRMAAIGLGQIAKAEPERVQAEILWGE